MIPRWLLALIPDPAARAAAIAASELADRIQQRVARRESRRRRALTAKANRISEAIEKSRQREADALRKSGEALDRVRELRGERP